MAADRPLERVFTVEAPGLTSGQVAAILERAIADGVHEIPERTGGRDRVTVGPLRGRMQGRAFVGSVTAWRGGSAGLWWHGGLTSPELELDGSLRDTEDGAELRVVARPGSNRPTVVAGLGLVVLIGGATVLSATDAGPVLVALVAGLIAVIVTAAVLRRGRARSLESSTDVHRFLTRVLRAGAADDTGWREATWR